MKGSLNVIIKIVILTSLMFTSNIFAKEHVVEIYKKKFIPSEITIAAGDTIIWKNIEKRQYHNVWFQQLFPEEPEYIFPDETYQLTFKDKGEFPYICGPHPKMTGLVTVK